MANYFCVRIRPNSYETSSLKFSNGKVDISTKKEFEKLDDLKAYIKNKKNINFVLFDNQFIKTSLSINRNISGRSAVNSTIFSKLQQEYPNADLIRFKATVSEDNPKKDTIKYAVHGLFQDSESYGKFNSIKTFQNCNLVTLENYALYEISKKFTNTRNFISIWSDGKSLSIVAGSENELFYSRNENLGGSTLSLVQEIIKNITFAKQRVRNERFDDIFMNGPVAFEGDLLETLKAQLRQEVGVFDPKEGEIGNISQEKFHENMIEIGTLFVPYELDFTSKVIKSHIQYNKALNIYMILMLFLCGYGFNEAVSSYEKYSLSKSSFTSHQNNIDALSNNLSLKSSNDDALYGMLDDMLILGNQNFIDQVTNIKNSVIELNNFSSKLKIDFDLENFKWEKGKNSELKISRDVVFDNLEELNKFKASIEELGKKLGKNVKLQPSYNLNQLTAFVGISFYGEAVK